MNIAPIGVTDNFYNKKTVNFNKEIRKNTTNSMGLSGFYPVYLSNINFSGTKKKSPNYELNLEMPELEKRTSKEALTEKRLLGVNAPEYYSLKKGDREALKHLVKAANCLNSVAKELDNPHNLPFEEYLNKETAKGNKQAELTKVLYDAQQGVCAVDREVNTIELAKGVHSASGKGFYPEDLTKEEFHNILFKMLDENKDKEVQKILNQRTVVERDGDELKAVDYVDKFKPEFTKMARELERASFVSTNKDFNEYLQLQARALTKADPVLDAFADKKWASLQDTPLEFTITRENYEDEMTESVLENKKLKELLDKRGITPVAKDSLGGRVGIVNKKGTEAILKVKDYLPIMAENMPYKNEYVQHISSGKDSKQTMVDVDLVSLTGEMRQYRAAITVAENLPNNDKLSLQMGGGRRNVYHRQIRQSSGADGQAEIKNKLDAVLNPAQHKYYNQEAEHWFTIGHENVHSLGPNGKDGLGKYKSIIEENKADMGSIAMLDVLTDKGLYTEEQKKQILVTYAVDNMLKAKPQMSQAHRVRSVMQTNYFMKEGAIDIDDKGVMTVNIGKMVPTAQKMLKEIIRVQIDGDMGKGEKYVMDNFVWTDKMQATADNLKRVSKSLNGIVKSPLADKLSNE